MSESEIAALVGAVDYHREDRVWVEALLWSLDRDTAERVVRGARLRPDASPEG